MLELVANCKDVKFVNVENSYINYGPCTENASVFQKNNEMKNRRK